jgi:hypothetical protein
MLQLVVCRFAFIFQFPLFFSLTSSLFFQQQSGNEEFEKIALYIFDDIIEFCGPNAAQYFSTFVPFLIKCAASESVLVRQPACYGLGISAKHVDPALVGPYCNGA